MQTEKKTEEKGRRCRRPWKLMFGSSRALNEFDVMRHAISINGINCRQGLKKTLDLYFSHSHFFMQGLGDDADDDVPPTAAYRHGVASENGRKADEEDVDDVQAGVATGGGTSGSRGGGRGWGED